MTVSLEEIKNYLRVSSSDDDALLEGIIAAGEHICLGILRSDDPAVLDTIPSAKLAVMYAVAYLYEHREDADHGAMNLTLRSLLFKDRKVVF